MSVCIYVHMSMYVCMYVCLYLCTYKHVCMYVGVFVCIYVHMSLYVCMYVCMHVCLYVFMYIWACMYTRVCMYVCTYACICTYVLCVYVYIYIMHNLLLFLYTPRRHRGNEGTEPPMFNLAPKEIVTSLTSSSLCPTEQLFVWATHRLFGRFLSILTGFTTRTAQPVAQQSLNVLQYPRLRSSFQQKQVSLHQQTELKFKEELGTALHLEHRLV